MKSVFIIMLLLLTGLAGKGQQTEADTDFPWQEEEEFWKDIYKHPGYRKFYKDENAAEMIRKAMEYAGENGVTAENMQDFLEELSEDITDNLLETFEEEVLDQLMEEVGIARYLDKAYEKLLKAALPQPGGIPVIDMGMDPAIKKGNTPHNLKVMLKLAVEKWLNEQWRKQSAGIYEIQRGDLEYRKKVGLIALLKMAELDYEHFMSLEIMLPEQVLDYAVQVQQIYQSAEESLSKGKELFTEFNIAGTGLEIPRQMEKLQLLDESNKKARTTSWEMINQRRKALALAYLQMAERAQQKGKDLQEAIRTEGHLKMSDGDRLKAQKIVQAYMEDYFRYKEKADLLLKASLENAGVEQKGVYMAKYQQSLRLKNLAK